MKKYKILRIDEPDFGCEGRPDGQPVMARVVLRDKVGEELVVEAGDAWLYQVDMKEGDMVFYSEEAGLEKYIHNKE